MAVWIQAKRAGNQIALWKKPNRPNAKHSMVSSKVRVPK